MKAADTLFGQLATFRKIALTARERDDRQDSRRLSGGVSHAMGDAAWPYEVAPGPAPDGLSPISKPTLSSSTKQVSSSPCG